MQRAIRSVAVLKSIPVDENIDKVWVIIMSPLGVHDAKPQPRYTIEKHGRNWMVIDPASQLVCITVYQEGCARGGAAAGGVAGVTSDRHNIQTAGSTGRCSPRFHLSGMTVNRQRKPLPAFRAGNAASAMRSRVL
jgi:hypothetical protein